MKSIKSTLAGLLLASTMCVAPSYAQEAQWLRDASGFAVPVPATLTSKQDATGSLVTDAAQSYASSSNPIITTTSRPLPLTPTSPKTASSLSEKFKLSAATAANFARLARRRKGWW